MGSPHKTTAKVIKQITEESDFNDMNDPHMFSIGFGGLHILKSPTNHLRNYALCLNGENYGVHLLRSLRHTPGPHSSVLANLKVSVINGKDRQSDLLSYETTASTAQETLSLAETYSCCRVPELVLSYTDNAQKQKRIMKPSSVQCNKNGDVFILDAGAAVVHAVDRSSVAHYVHSG